MAALAVERSASGAAGWGLTRLVGSSRDRAWIGRTAFLVAWPTLLVVSVYSRFGGTSLASPDDGFILAQSRRILAGQIPHRDFISPRPVGSALIHCIDFLVPLPLLQASRLVSAIEVVTYSLAFAALAFRRPLRSWSIAQIGLAAGAVFVNLHSFPLMAWHTIDGLMLTAVGFVMVRRGMHVDRWLSLCVGMLLLGSAVVVKQSFAAAPLVGVVTVWANGRTVRPPIGAALAMGVATLPGLSYAGFVTVAGGLRPMMVQMANAQPTFGSPLVTVLWRNGIAVPSLAAFALALVAIDLWAGRAACPTPVVLLGTRVGLSALVVAVLLVTRTDPNDAWGRALLLLLVVVVVGEWLRRRRLDHFGAAMIVVAWMTSLSWGYPTPRLVAGSIALVVLDRVWREAPSLPLAGRAGVGRFATLFVVVASIAVIATAVRERAVVETAASRDATLSAVAPDLRGVRTTMTTSALFHNVAACRLRYPARWTAVLPGPAALYPIMKLDNPFSADWLYPPELRGSAARLVGEAKRLDVSGDYLVLVSKPFDTGPNRILAEMVRQLHGARSVCSGLLAIHAT